MTYQTQINATEPQNWKRLEADSVRWAAIYALRRARFTDFPCTVYVGLPKPLHDNGAPMIVHAFEIVRSEVTK